MRLPLAEAAAHLPDLATRAEAGPEIVVTRDDAPSVRLVVDGRHPARDGKPSALDAMEGAGAQASVADREAVKERRRRALAKYNGILKGQPGLEGVTAANIADDLYDEHGLPA